jgi:hypothetical protein
MEKCHLEGGMAQLALDPMPATFEKPEEKKRRHLKALFLKGQVDGRPVTKLLVDGGAAVNIRPYAMFRKLGKGEEDLIKTDMMLKDFEGNVSLAWGALCVDLTIGSKTLPTTLFVVNGKGPYNLPYNMRIVASLRPCANVLFNGSEILCRFMLIPPSALLQPMLNSGVVRW